jgi:hydrogenase expression/formation protein HypC
MCLGVPGKIQRVVDGDALRMGEVAFGAIRKEVCLAYVPEAGVGDWVVVHAGFAISQLDAEQAVETLQMLGAPLPVDP